MRKILKRIAALSAAVMMMGTMVISASAAYPTATSSQQNGKSWKITTSVSKSNTTVNASGTGYYYITKTTYGSASNGNGSATSGVTCYLTNTKGHGWSSVTSTHTATAYSKRTLNKTGSYVS